MWTCLFEDTKSKFLDVSDVDAEERVDDSLVGILKLKLGFGTWILIKILKQEFGQDFEVNFWWRLWAWDVVKILKVKFGPDFEAEAKFGRDYYC